LFGKLRIAQVSFIQLLCLDATGYGGSPKIEHNHDRLAEVANIQDVNSFADGSNWYTAPEEFARLLKSYHTLDPG